MAGLMKRGKTYYAVYSDAGKERRRSLETDSYKLAKERLREIEARLAQGLPGDTGPTKTPLQEVVAAYAAHIASVKTPSSLVVDTWYLRDIFGPICTALEPARYAKNDKRVLHIEAAFLEQLTTAHIAAFIDGKVRDKGLVAKTANRYREVLMRLFSWAMSQRGVRTPGNVNPAAQVERRREPTLEICFLTLPQVQEQLFVLADDPQLQVMVATYIYAGLRRQELLWLTHNDVALRAGKHGMIRVRAKTIDGEYWEPKTKANRSVPVSRTLRAILDAYRPPKGAESWYFPSPKGFRWNGDNFSTHLRTVNRKAGLRWSCLDYRHTFGSQLAMKGESLYKIATLMGNSPEICRRHYAALLPESLTQSVEFEEEEEELPPAPAPETGRAAHPRLRLIVNEEA